MSITYGTPYEVVTSVTDDYTVPDPAVTPIDAVIATVATAKTVTLYSASGKFPKSSQPGGIVRVVNATGSSAALTVASASTIYGPATLQAGDSITFEADGLSWYASGTGANSYTASVTPGTAVASKAVILGASKEIATITSATITTLTSTTVGATTANVTTVNATTVNPTNIVRASQSFQLGRAGTAKAGTTSGWTVNAATNIGPIATCPASQSGATLVVAIPNLHVGDTITGFSVYSSIGSVGGAVTLDANLRSLTIAAAATATDASIASITQVSVSTATASTATKGSLSTVVAAGVNYYLLLTATTAASTSIEVDQIQVTVTSA
jgi:hypothetical protein